MKIKINILIGMFLLSVLLTSCSIPYETPYGKWQSQSEDMSLVLDINPNVIKGPFVGTYKDEKGEINILFYFAYEKSFTIFDEKDVTEESIKGDNALFCGYFKIKDEKLYYTLKPHWQELTGITEPIVFEKIENYKIPSEDK